MYKHCSEIGNKPDDLAQDADLLIMGVTPSGRGRLHQGHHVTLFNYLRTLAKTRTARGVIHIDDREFCLQLDPKLVDPALSAQTEAQIHQCLQASASFLHEDRLPERVEVRRMSDIFREPIPTGENLGARYLDVLRERTAVSAAFQGMSLQGPYGIRSFCPSCERGYNKDPRHTKLYEGMIDGQCQTDSCNVDRYRVEVAQGDTRWTVFYGLVSLMAVPLSEQIEGGSILEFLGGDYGTPWGKTNSHFGDKVMAKGERASVATEILTGRRDLIKHYVGPLLEVRGRKLSKSKGDEAKAMDCARLEEWLSRNTPVIDVSAIDQISL